MKEREPLSDEENEAMPEVLSETWSEKMIGKENRIDDFDKAEHVAYSAKGLRDGVPALKKELDSTKNDKSRERILEEIASREISADNIEWKTDKAWELAELPLEYLENLKMRLRERKKIILDRENEVTMSWHKGEIDSKKKREMLKAISSENEHETLNRRMGLIEEAIIIKMERRKKDRNKE